MIRKLMKLSTRKKLKKKRKKGVRFKNRLRIKDISNLM